eukprot:scaffold226078_cov20-Tisochrysis_lutea.AAC.2
MERRPACSVQKASLGLTPVHPFDFLFQLPRAGMHLLASCDALATNLVAVLIRVSCSSLQSSGAVTAPRGGEKTSVPAEKAVCINVSEPASVQGFHQKGCASKEG